MMAIGVDLPRVTQIRDAVGLGPDLNGIPPSVRELARYRGQRVHEAIESIVLGLDVDRDDLIDPYVNAFRAFCTAAGFQSVYAETRIVHPTWHYQGHIDLIGWMGPIRTLIDVKTGAADGAAVQVAGYFDAWNLARPSEQCQAAAVLQLRDDGLYRFREVDIPAALPLWQAAVLIYRARPEKDFLR